MPNSDSSSTLLDQLAASNKGLEKKIGDLEKSLERLWWGGGFAALLALVVFGVDARNLRAKINNLMETHTLKLIEHDARTVLGNIKTIEGKVSDSSEAVGLAKKAVEAIRKKLEDGKNLEVNGDLLVHGTVRVNGPPLHGDKIDPSIDATAQGQTIITGFQVAVIGENTTRSDGSVGTSRALLTAHEGTAGMAVNSFPKNGKPREIKLKISLDGDEVTLPKKQTLFE